MRPASRFVQNARCAQSARSASDCDGYPTSRPPTAGGSSRPCFEANILSSSSWSSRSTGCRCRERVRDSARASAGNSASTSSSSACRSSIVAGVPGRARPCSTRACPSWKTPNPSGVARPFRFARTMTCRPVPETRSLGVAVERERDRVAVGLRAAPRRGRRRRTAGRARIRSRPPCRPRRRRPPARTSPTSPGSWSSRAGAGRSGSRAASSACRSSGRRRPSARRPSAAARAARPGCGRTRSPAPPTATG